MDFYNKEKDSQRYYIDIETDDVKATVVHLIIITNIASRETWEFYGPDLSRRFKAWLNDHPEAIFVGHNAVSFDVPTLNRLLEVSIDLDRVIDTLVLSYLYNPQMPGGHSLESYGIRLKFPKGKFNDFSEFSTEMLDYCRQDVALGIRVFLALRSKLQAQGFSERSIALEHRIRIVIDRQQANGFYFDIRAAQELYRRLREEQERLGIPIQELFPPVLERQATYNRKFKQDGSDYASFVRHQESYPKIVVRENDYDVYDWKTFNIGSPKQRIERLLGLGYEPTDFTPTGQPKVDEESLIKFADSLGVGEKASAVKAIADWLVVSGRANMINTWLNNVNYEDSRMHGRVFSCGAGTRRMTHSGPNTANIPSNEARYGSDCRALWTVSDPSTRRLVGFDAKALEMRMFAHYLNNADAAKLYIEGDPHSVNAELVGIPRKPVKNVFYAFLYGAQDRKLGATAEGRGADFGREIRRKLTEGTPGLKRLVEQVQREYKDGGWIECIDGGYVRCPSPHAALNYKLQSAGGIVMKQASIFIQERLDKGGYDALKVGDIHDEGQFDTHKDCASEVGELCVQALRDAGEELGFRVPLDGDYKVGLGWHETH